MMYAPMAGAGRRSGCWSGGGGQGVPGAQGAQDVQCGTRGCARDQAEGGVEGFAGSWHLGPNQRCSWSRR
jgi:hypothetical protein